MCFLEYDHPLFPTQFDREWDGSSLSLAYENKKYKNDSSVLKIMLPWLAEVFTNTQLIR